MNGFSNCSLSRWSAVQDGEASVLSKSVVESKMAYHRKREDGSYEKNLILKKIYKDLGTLSMTYRNPYGMTYSKFSFPGPQKRPKAENPLRTGTFAHYEPYKAKGTPRYSKIDKFIDNLNQACAALPKPLMEDFGRVRPQTVAVQSQPKKEVRMIQVRGSEPTPQLNEGEQEDDQALSEADSERSKRPIDYGLVPVPRVTQINIRASPEMGPWKIADETNRDCEGQAAKQFSDDSAFEGKKVEVVRAATMLQSRYRGYKVRRSQPLKYMLMIGNAKSKLEELKQQFSGWKIAVWFPTAYSERLTMTENIMKLLMELDTIQGVPQYIRDFRKRVARDVSKFQEEVDAFLRHNNKRGALFELVRNENMRRPQSTTERRTGSRNITEIASGNDPPPSWKTVQVSSNPQRAFGPVEELAGALSSNHLSSAPRGDSRECESENIVQCDQLEPEINVPMCPEEVVRPQEVSFLCPQPPVKPKEDPFSSPESSVELVARAENKINHDETNQAQRVGPQTCDAYIPLRDDSSRNLRKKKYEVRFEDDVNQKELNSGIEPCLVTQQSSGSPNEDSSSHVAAIVKSDDEYYVAYTCSDDSGRRELTDIREQRDVIYPSASTAMPVAEKLVCLTTDAGDGTESRKERGQPGPINALFDQAPATQVTTVTVHVHSSEPLANKSSGYMEEPSCLDSNGDENVRGRLEYQALMADTTNASANRFGAVTIPSKSRFHNEQSHLRTSTDGSIQPGHSRVNYEGSCRSSDGTTSETSEKLEGMEEHQGKCEAFHSEATGMKVLTLALEQKQMVTISGDDTELGVVLKSPRLGRSSGNVQSICISPSNALEERTSDAEADIEIGRDVDIDGVPEVETVSCCSDCAGPRGHYPFECWKCKVSTSKEEPLLRHPCNGYPEEVHEGYVPVGYKDTGGRGDYFRHPARAEFSGFDHSELRYIADPCTLKLRRVRQAAGGRTAKKDQVYFHREKCRLVPRPVQHVPKAHANKATTPSPPESICSEAERSYQRCRSHSPPYRQIVVSEERGPWETDEGQIPDKELLTKLADDNKSLKGLLKDLMNWNKAQATAMVSMSERIEHLEGLNKLP